jgi:hypothetical protein
MTEVDEAAVKASSELKGLKVKLFGEKAVKYGKDFGKMGVYAKNPGIKVDWSQFAEHGFERMAERGVTKDMINSIVKNGKVLSQNGGNKFAYITQEGVAVVSKEGKLITAWGKDNFDDNMIKIVNELYGK